MVAVVVVRACVRMCARVCRAFGRVCVCVCVCVRGGGPRVRAGLGVVYVCVWW